MEHHSFLHVWTPCPVVTTTGMSPPVQELHLWNLHGRQQLSTTTGIPQPVQELHLWNLHGLQQLSTTTGMSATLSENCNCGTSTVFCTVNPKHLSLHNNWCHQPVQDKHLWDLAGLLHSLHFGYTSLEHNGKVHHSVDELELGHLHVHAHNGLRACR